MMQHIRTIGFLFFTFIGNLTLFAHGAHEHGVANLQIALEANKITIVLESPAESFYGFEHEAKTDAEKKTKKAALDALKNTFEQFVIFSPDAQCKISNTKLDVVKEDEDEDEDHDAHAGKTPHQEEHHGEHREIRGEWIAECRKPASGSLVEFKFSKRFPRISKIKVDLLSDKKQTHQDLKNGDGKVQL